MRINGVNSAQDNTLQIKNQSNDDLSKASGQDVHQEAADEAKVPKISLPKGKYEKNGMSISEKVVTDAIEKVNKALEGPNRRLQFSVHKPTHEIMVKVIDNDTGEVIREIPPEKVLDRIAKMQEMAGILVDEKR